MRAPCLVLAVAVGSLGDWQAPVVLRDLRSACCAAAGREVTDDRMCCWLDNVLSRSECNALLKLIDEHHDEQGEDDLVPGLRSQFGSSDSALAAFLWGTHRRRSSSGA